MKFISILLSLATLSVSAQNSKWLWPIEGAKTGTGYHYMTAVKFAHLALPHSHIEYTLPLVKSVADDTVTERFPAKRGLMPDIEVPLTYDEYYAPEGDPIMEKALEVLKSN